MLLDCKCFCLWATFKFVGRLMKDCPLEWMTGFLTLPYFKMTYNIKIARIKDIILSPFPPIKGSLKSYCRSTKVEMVVTKKTLIIPFRILEYGQSLCVWVSDPIKKVGTDLFDAQKGRKRQNTELYWYFQNPKIALIISLMLQDYW